MMFRPITLQEANLFLPLVKEHFVQIHELVAEGQQLHDSISSEKNALHVDGSPETSVNWEAQTKLEEIESQIKGEVMSLQYYGAIVKSVFPARVDFLSERHKQPVFLCWQMGDNSVSHWHPVDEGFTSRQAIHTPQVFGPVVVH